jgi:hypothetical protein
MLNVVVHIVTILFNTPLCTKEANLCFLPDVAYLVLNGWGQVSVVSVRHAKHKCSFPHSLTHCRVKKPAARRRHRHAPLEGASHCYVTKTHPASLSQLYCVDIGLALCFTARSIRKAWPQKPWHGQWQVPLVHLHVSYWPIRMYSRRDTFNQWEVYVVIINSFPYSGYVQYLHIM